MQWFKADLKYYFNTNTLWQLPAAICVLLWVAFAWGLLILLCAPLQVPVSIIACFRDTYSWRGIHINWKGWRYSIWVGQDQMVASLLGQNIDTHISGVVGYWASQNYGIALWMEVVVDWLFYLSTGQLSHCREAIEHDETYYKGVGK